MAISRDFEHNAVLELHYIRGMCSQIIDTVCTQLDLTKSSEAPASELVGALGQSLVTSQEGLLKMLNHISDFLSGAENG